MKLLAGGGETFRDAFIKKRLLRLLILLLLPVACTSVGTTSDRPTLPPPQPLPEPPTLSASQTLPEPPTLQIPAAKPNRPNIVLMIGDDHGYPDFGFMGSPTIHTPNLDRLAAGGTLFTLGYTTASTCRPALLSLLTGFDMHQYFARKQELIARLEAEDDSMSQSGIEHFETLPRILASRGYVSFQAGKYWESHFTEGGFTHGMGKMAEAVTIGRETMEPVYDFIDEHLDRPFFLWFAPKLPHVPFDAPQEFFDPFKDLELPDMTRGYYANIFRFDAAVGDLVNHLEERGLREKTLIVYVVDNGWQVEGFNQYGLRWDGPKGKNSLYELGLRTPIIFSWSGQIPAGEVNDDPVTILDLFPTILDYAGVTDPPTRLGFNLRPVLEGEAELPQRTLVGRMVRIRTNDAAIIATGQPETAPGGFFARSRKWHFIDYDDREDELYDMLTDSDQEHNVFGRYPAVTAQLRSAIGSWFQPLNDFSKLRPVQKKAR